MNGKFSIPFLLSQKNTVCLKVMYTVLKYISLTLILLMWSIG